MTIFASFHFLHQPRLLILKLGGKLKIIKYKSFFSTLIFIFFSIPFQYNYNSTEFNLFFYLKKKRKKRKKKKKKKKINNFNLWFSNHLHKLISPDPEAWFVGQFAAYLLRPTDDFTKELERWKQSTKTPYGASKIPNF